MQSEQFNKLIADISELQFTKIEDISLLTERYPYCQTAHILYAKKLHTDRSHHFDKHLKTAAVYTFDREVLYKFIEETQGLKGDLVESKYENSSSEMGEKEQVITDDDFELKEKDIEQTIIPEKQSEGAVEQVVPLKNNDDAKGEVDKNSSNASGEIQHKEENISNENEDDGLKKDINKVVEEVNNFKEEEFTENSTIAKQHDPVFEMPLYNIERELVQSGNIINETIQGRVENIGATVGAAQPEKENFIAAVHTFSEWLIYYGGSEKPVIVQLREGSKAIVIDKKPLPTLVEDFSEKYAGDLARKSLQINESLITETYASILLKQGKTVQAIRAYEMLSLKNPEKSDYFASIIEKAQNQLK
jgi:hypothetical protein